MYRYRQLLIVAMLQFAPIASLFVAANSNAQPMLKASPLDNFPANGEALNERAKSSPELAAALDAFRSGDVEKLKSTLADYKTKNADAPFVDVMLARLLMANGQWPDALATLEKHVAETPISADAHKSFAEIAMISGRWTDAWLQLERAYTQTEAMKYGEKRKRDFIAELVKLRGEVAEQRKDTATAKKLFETLKKLRPEDGTADWALGRLKIAEGDVEGGASLLRDARKLDSSLPQPELAIALDLAAKGDKKGAEKWFESSVADKENSGLINWLQYLQFLVESERTVEAKKLAESVPEQYRDQRDFRLAEAIIYRHLGYLSEAEQILSSLHRTNPNDLDVGDHLSLVLIESDDEGKRARAAQLSEANFRRAPNVERVAATVAWVNFRTGSADVADKILGDLIRGGQISPQTAYYAAKVLTSLNKKDEAAQFFKIAADAPGNFPQKEEARLESAGK